ncbi:seryl-tRNA synthetase [Babesia caballi]|uniref:Serine--tRNA ligase n=1 Tax=Babesia caballi TaxID=5871 RepID=A0AAV4M0M6_BABCB|nr:seryl-tRNA synthetase [Babesia caballi]
MCTLAFRALTAFVLLSLIIEGCRRHCLAHRFGQRHAYLFHRTAPIHANTRQNYRISRKALDSDRFHSSRYSDSDVYQRLSSCFTESEKTVDEQVFKSLKDSVVRLTDAGHGYVPSSFDLTALTAVPELFNENFRLRLENHWETLLQIRELYLESSAKEKELETLSTRRSELAQAFHSSPDSEKEQLRQSSLELRDAHKSLESHIKSLNDRIEALVFTLPNIVSEGVPPTEVVVEKTSGSLPSSQPQETVVPHYEVIDRLSAASVSKSIKISGTGFSAFSGDVSRLERALANYMLDTHHKLFGYTEFSVPFVVNEFALRETGHLPRFENDLYKLDERHQCGGGRGYLIPTGEIPLLALFGNTRLDFNTLPLWLATYTPCFRSEIQDYGRETRGLIRNRQFGKVELICLCDSEASAHFHDLMVSHIEYILDSLSLPYRRVLLPATQLCATSSKTVDIEVFFPSLNKYVEVSSCSNTLDYQSTRLNLLTTSRSKVHCINGSGLAIGRTLSAVLEHYQHLDSNGRLQIRVPEVLQPYLGGDHTVAEPLP